MKDAYYFKFDIEPRTKARFSVGKNGGYWDKKTSSYLKELTLMVQEQWKENAFDTALRVKVVFHLTRPPSVPKKRKYPYKKPDKDNLEKALWDCMEKGGVFVNDSRICKAEVEKVYAENTGFIEIWLKVMK